MPKRSRKQQTKAAATKSSATKKGAAAKQVGSISHATSSKRKNIPTAEYQSAAERQEELDPRAPVMFRRSRPLAQGEKRDRNTDVDPQIIWKGARIRLTDKQIAQLQEKGEIEIGDAQLVWRGKDEQDWSDLVVTAPPLYIQDKIHPQAIIDDLVRQSQETRKAGQAAVDDQLSMFADHFHDFNGLNDPEMRTEFYQHDQYWQNRMILGDSLAVMASLAERESLRGKVQCIYFDPPYGIKFSSNWQVSTQSRDVKEKTTDVSREPEQVKAFRDTWKDGIHSYLTYLRDRLTVARELLTDSGSVFVQIGDENVHRVRAVLDEVFGEGNSCAQITVVKTASATSEFLPGVADYILWFAKDKSALKFRQTYSLKQVGGQGGGQYTRLQLEDGIRRTLTKGELAGEELPSGGRVFRLDNMTSQRPPGDFPVEIAGRRIRPSKGYWKTGEVGMPRLARAQRLELVGNTLTYVRFIEDFRVYPINNVWTDTGASGFGDDKTYVVQTIAKIVERCILMTTDPGDIVLDPTCGSGTTATVAEQWGRRWITIDTSRVALALARTRLMSARYPFYLLADSREGRKKEQEVSGKFQPDTPPTDDIRQGFVYERAPHITLKSIANNTAIDDIWERWQATLEPLRADLNKALKQTWEEWQIPRDAGTDWSDAAEKTHAAWWDARISRQKEIDAAIAKAADVEYLYDRPYADNSRVRVAGPFTVESLSPHRVIPSGDIDLSHDLGIGEPKKKRRAKLAAPPSDFTAMIIEHLRSSGVQQGAKGDRIELDPISGWPGEYIGAEGIFIEKNGKGPVQRRAAILIGPEFGTLSRVDLVAAAREATEARFDVLIACAFSYDAHASELNKLAALPILKAKMNPDLHMAGELKNTGKGNLFIVFGEPDIEVLEHDGDQIAIKINGVDVFDQNTGAIRSGDTKSIAAWFIDTNYNEESFFVRHAYFLGANDPYKSLKTALRAEIDEEAWATLYRDISRPFLRPSTGRIAVKVINHFGDEVMKAWKV